MAQAHENPDTITQLSIDFGEEARREALDNGSGFSPHSIDVIRTGIDSDAESGYHGLAQRVRDAASSRRSGRGYNEGSDSDLDPEWNVLDKASVSEEERAISHQAYLDAKAEVARRTAVIKYDELVETAREHGISPDTLLQARLHRDSHKKTA